MFSGIVEEFATVVAIEKEQENVHFTLTCSFVDELKIDQSVAHNGGRHSHEGDARPEQSGTVESG